MEVMTSRCVLVMMKVHKLSSCKLKLSTVLCLVEKTMVNSSALKSSNPLRNCKLTKKTNIVETR